MRQIHDRYVRFVRLDECTHRPEYATRGAAGLDVYAARPSAAHPWRCVERVEVEVDSLDERADEAVELQPGERAVIPIGVRVAVPYGFELQIRPRSGLAMRHGLTVANAPGTIDSDYRGPVGVLLVNHGLAPVAIRPGDRIAQMVLAPVVRAVLDEVDELPETARGAGGWGSTGVNEAAGRPDAP
jgi:dUTP pyrophosphatase